MATPGSRCHGTGGAAGSDIGSTLSRAGGSHDDGATYGVRVPARNLLGEEGAGFPEECC